MNAIVIFVLAVMVSVPAFADRGIELTATVERSQNDHIAASSSATLTSVILSESFDTGVPASWTAIADPGGLTWASNDVWGRDNITGGSGGSVGADADVFGGGGDTSLHSPVLDLSVATAPVAVTSKLNFQAFADNGEFWVDASTTDAAGPWTNLYNQSEDSPTQGQVVNLDISSLADQANVILRFRFKTPDWDWYAYIDDVVVSEEVPAGDEIFSNSFEDEA